MIKVDALISFLKKNNTDFYTGVPDSVLKEFCSILKNKKNHIIATNEGAAISLGIGYYLATKKIPCVYMQNSGLSNALNPLISIAHKKVYSIPLILVIGWRGSPRIKDEPQHKVKGEITQKLLNLLNIKHTIIRTNKDLNKFDKQIKFAKKNKTIVACLIEQGTLEKDIKKNSRKDYYKLDKEAFLKIMLQNIPINSKIISSTGYNSREIMYLVNKYKLNKTYNFYMVGGMGHTSSVALGYSLFSKNKIICIDGDGSLLMHLGALKTAGYFAKNNFKYILLNNNTHDSVGGQSTYADNINFEKLSKSLGFKKSYTVYNHKNLEKKIKNFLNIKAASFMEVKVTNSKIKKLPRPKDLIKIKKEFMN
ncbi:phosphonopyruvate decarboxylase [Candidatus Pelagibacter sp.]|uniref:phosphonopyruvate decarboxylase n=1 Tax=Candidatus Pelagibacter sp. TaxID=2024849 RepID=UPI003F8782FA